MRGMTCGVLLMTACLLSGGVCRAERDDTILAEHLAVSARAYHRMLQDFEQLRTSLTAQGSESPGLDHPKMREFIERSFGPTENEFRRLAARYALEHGTSRLRKLANDKKFSDLLDR